ncbi:hypothetical protein [Ancylobacter sp. IITR112]|uniref:hypothetical protein n=1 Tax=Ancylobacter sp. IITR112 TaxID=3138073 RepID=UPI00352AFCB9
MSIAERMLRKWWDHLAQGSQSQAKAIGAQLIKIDRDIEKLLDRVVDASVPSVIAAYEDRIRALEEEKIVLREKASKLGRPASSFDDTLRTALEFLSNPWNLWDSGRLEDRRAVLKLAFAERLRYMRKTGFRTADLSLPFKVLGAFGRAESEMARRPR